MTLTTCVLVSMLSAFAVAKLIEPENVQFIKHKEPVVSITIASSKKPKTVYQDLYLLPLLQKIALKGYSDINIEFSDSFYNENTIGTYLYSTNTIKIKSNLPYDYQVEVIAHEYIHYVWARIMTQSEIKTVSNLIDSIDYQNYTDLNDRLINYSNSDRLNPIEIFPIFCSELPDYRIPSLYQECSKYIDRSFLPLVLLQPL